MLSKRVQSLEESATLKVNALVNQLKAEGKQILNLTAGEPDFSAPEEAKQAVIEALEKNLSRYTPTAGVPELRQLIAKKTNRQQPQVAQENPWEAAHVVVSNGGKQAIFDIILSLVNPGDEVVVNAPYWLSYPQMVNAAEGKTVAIPTTFEANYQITPQQLEAAITDRTRLWILNSPSNPTGATYSREALKALGAVIRKHPQVWVISDEIYDQIDYSELGWCSFLDANPDLRDRTATVNGLSKSGAMTGWRIGWSVAPKRLTQGLIALQGHSTSGISSLSQAAAIAALKMSPEKFSQQLKQYLNRRNLALEVLQKCEKIKVYRPDGAFYLFLDLEQVMMTSGDSIQDANGFAEKLLQQEQVAVVSGADFGAPKSIRLSFATDEKTLVDACTRIVRFVERLCQA